MNDVPLIDLVIFCLVLVPLFLVVLDGVHRLGFLVVVHWPRRHRKGPQNSQVSNLELLLLIAARNEQRVLEGTLARIRDQVEADDLTRVAVIADHCSDETASIATAMGARVYVRSEGQEGKAQSLSWFVREGKDLLGEIDIVAVLDADTLPEARFCDRIRSAFEPGVDAVQGFVDPVYRHGFPLAMLASYSEILAQKIDDAARSRLNWSVPLRGTGMAFREKTFSQGCEKLRTQVDDIELSIRLAETGVQVHFCPEAIVLDTKSESLMGLARQRARWLTGQRQIWKQELATILKLAGSGAPSWSLFHALLLKPKTAMILIKAALIIILLLWPLEGLVRQVALLAAAGSLLVDVAYYLLGLEYVSEKRKYAGALLGAPLFVALWAVSWVVSLLPGRGWLRARDDELNTRPGSGRHSHVA